MISIIDTMLNPLRHLLVSILILLFFMQTAIAGGSSEIPIQPTETEAAQTGETEEKVLTIATGTDPSAFSGALYEGLCSYNPETALPSAGLAEKWGKNIDGTQWFFSLRPDLKYSDGTPVLAQDFIDSWVLLADKGNSSASMLDVITGFREYRTGTGSREDIGVSADGNEITITLTELSPYLPMILANPCFAPKYLTQSFTGPYTLTKANMSYALLSKNPFYWDKDNVATETVKLDLRGSGEAVYHDYQDGKIQWAACYIPEEYLSTGEEYVASHQWATSFFYWLAADGPYADPETRRIFTSVIPWETIRYIVSGPLPTYALVPDSRAKQKIKTLKNETARKQLRAAGCTELPKLKIAVPEGTQIVTAASLIAEIWKRVFSIEVQLDEVDDISVYTDNPAQSDYDFAWVNWIGDYYDPLSFLDLFYSKSSYNIAGYSSPEYDRLLEEACACDDVRQRSTALVSAEQYLLNTYTVIPVENPIATNFVKFSQIEGWYDNALDIHPLKAIHFTQTDLTGVLRPYPMD